MVGEHCLLPSDPLPMGPSSLPTSEDLGPGSESSGGIWSWRFPGIWPGRGSLGLALHCRWLPAWPCAVPGPLQASVGAGRSLSSRGLGGTERASRGVPQSGASGQFMGRMAQRLGTSWACRGPEGRKYVIVASGEHGNWVVVTQGRSSQPWLHVGMPWQF